VRETLERELKLSVGSDFTLPPLPVEATPRDLRAVYYDTSDHRLASRGVTLRRRLEDGRDAWQLKLPAGRDRTEIECDADGPGIPAELARLVTAYVRGRELLPLAELHTVRRAIRVTSDGKPAVEVVHDTVDVCSDGRVVRSFAEVEIEQLVDGAERLVGRLERQLRAAGARRSDGRPKVFQALDLPAAGGAVRLERGAPAIEHVREYLLQQIDALVGGDPRTRRAEGEGVHAMRVATRRLRSALNEARRLLDPTWVDELRAELEWLGAALGEVRDADVFAAYVEQAAEKLGPGAAPGGSELVALIVERSQDARSRLAEVLDSARYLALLDRLDAIRVSLPVTPERVSLHRTLERAARRVRRRTRGISSSPSDRDLHRLRLAAKRARYAGELAQRAVGTPARRLAERAADLQSVLGDHQDAVVAEVRLESIAADASPAGAYVAGRLVERQRERRLTARAALPKALRRFAAAADRL
jgi:CHAD domain-containing protein